MLLIVRALYLGLGDFKGFLPKKKNKGKKVSTFLREDLIG